MTHKKKYVVDGNKVSEYNKEYYKKHRNEMNKRSKQRLKDNPNINKEYYTLHKEEHKKYSKKYYKDHREEILELKKIARDLFKNKGSSIVLM